MESKAFEKMYLLQLQDLYSAGKQLSDALPKLIKMAHLKEFKLFLKELCDKNKQQLGRIENILRKSKNFNPQSDNCDIVEEFLEEADEWLEVTSNPLLSDAGLILLIKKINHYQIAVYESVISYSHIINLDKIAEALSETAVEVRNFNARLNEILEEAGGVLVK